ncbi:MAG: metallophosphoesterase family protein [Candidatus Melainabacteria bacterium]|nr:metallophosphoesterase family protein [Candidatus Melainabacteria bacterium]
MRILLTLLVFTLSNLPALAKNKIVRGPYLQAASDNSMVIRWRTKQATPTFIRYKAYGDKNELQYQDLVRTTEHEAKLIDLKPRTKYFYSIYGLGKKGKELLADDRINSFFFTTFSPAGKQDYKVYAWVLGDPGTNGTKKYKFSDKKSQLLVRDAFYAYHHQQQLPSPNLILSLGDNAYPSASDKDLQRAFFEPYQDVMTHIPIFPVFGNHDSGYDKNHTSYNARSYPQPHGVYYDAFSFPNENKAYYSFDYARVHFIVLDSYDSYWQDLKADRSNLNKIYDGAKDSSNAMLDWLKQDLESTDADWTIVAYHHPAYATADDDPPHGRWQDWIKKHVVPILEEHKVDLVLNGHVHNYQRSYPMKNFEAKSAEKNIYSKGQGTIYTILGSSGQSWNQAHTSDLHPVAHAKEGSVLVKATPHNLELKFISLEAKVLDKFSVYR